MIAPFLSNWSVFLRSSRGGVPVELALGGFVLISAAVLCFDLYARIEADTSIARMAVTMADYVSRETAPDGAEMSALGEFLRDHELAFPADLVFVVTALRQPSGDPRPGVDVLWTDDTIQLGDPAVTGALSAGCAHFKDAGVLPDNFTMADDEVLIVAGVCARLTGAGFLTSTIFTGDIHRLHALPARDPGQPPAAPVHSVRNAGRTLFAHGATRQPGRAGPTDGDPRDHDAERFGPPEADARGASVPARREPPGAESGDAWRAPARAPPTGRNARFNPRRRGTPAQPPPLQQGALK